MDIATLLRTYSDSCLAYEPLVQLGGGLMRGGGGEPPKNKVK